MRTRAYRPEAPARLEDRSMLSGVPGPSADPVVLPRRQYIQIVEHMAQGFQLFAKYHDVTQLLSEIDDVVTAIPFARADGLRGSIDGIVDRMEHDIRNHTPYPIRGAMRDVLATTRAGVMARVRAGDLVIR